MIDTICKNLAQLPYDEMLLLAQYLSENLDPLMLKRPEVVASVLSRARHDLTQHSSQDHEKQLLSQAFARKRVVSVKTLGTAFVIEIPSIPGTVVTGTDLRAMLGQMLDQVVTMEVLGGGSTRGR